MKKSTGENLRIKRDYFHYLKHARGQTAQAVDAAAKAIDRFESSNGQKPFKAFRDKQAMAFKDRLALQIGVRSKEPLSAATVYATLSALKAFFRWLAEEPIYGTKIVKSHADYFSPSGKHAAIAKAKRQTPVPTPEQIRAVLNAMPHATDIEKRDRALIAFTLLTGARDSAIASLRLGDVDFIEGKVEQDARHVETKFSKSFTTFFFPVGDDIRVIVEEWVHFLLNERAFGPGDALFPKTRISVGASGQFESVGLMRQGWSNATAIRSIFKEAFKLAGLRYFNPHSFRNTLVRFGQQTCQTPEAFKAWSQNLGHDQVMTTLSSYGHVETRRQGELIRDLGMTKDDIAELIAIGRAARAAMQPKGL